VPRKRALYVTAKNLQVYAASMAEIILNPEKYGYIPCPTCHGYGEPLKDPGIPVCGRCQGKGTIHGQYGWTTCRECHGLGTLRVDTKCPDCRGHGVVLKSNAETEKVEHYDIVVEQKKQDYAVSAGGENYLLHNANDAVKAVRLLWELGVFDRVLGHSQDSSIETKDLTAPFADQEWDAGTVELQRLSEPGVKYISRSRREQFQAKQREQQQREQMGVTEQEMKELQKHAPKIRRRTPESLS